MTLEPFSVDLRGHPDADLEDVVDRLWSGGLVAHPTETVYGLGGVVSDAAVKMLRERKGRDDAKAIIVLVESAAAVADLAWTDSARELARLFWPGALTLVLDDPLGIFPDAVKDPARGTVGVRVSPHPVVARLLRQLGGPLTSTSLNGPGEAPARSGSEALEVVRKMGGWDVTVLDVGTLPEAHPSTVVDCTDKVPVVLREGSVPVDRLRCAIPEIHGRQHV